MVEQLTQHATAIPSRKYPLFFPRLRVLYRMHVLSYDDGGMTRVVQITFHQLLLNGNVTAITAITFGVMEKGKSSILRFIS